MQRSRTSNQDSSSMPTPLATPHICRPIRFSSGHSSLLAAAVPADSTCLAAAVRTLAVLHTGPVEVRTVLVAVHIGLAAVHRALGLVHTGSVMSRSSHLKVLVSLRSKVLEARIDLVPVQRRGAQVVATGGRQVARRQADPRAVSCF